MDRVENSSMLDRYHLITDEATLECNITLTKNDTNKRFVTVTQ